MHVFYTDTHLIMSQKRSLMQKEEETRGRRTDWKKKGEKKNQHRHNISVATLHLLCWVRSVFFCFFFKCQLWFHQALKGSPTGHQMPLEEKPSGSIQQTLICLQTHLLCAALEQHETKPEVKLHRNCYCSANQHKMQSWWRERKKDSLALQSWEGRLWRLTHRSKSASPHALGRAPAMLLGSICCSTQLKVIQGASLQEDLKTSVAKVSHPSLEKKWHLITKNVAECGSF